ncbi:MORN repeat-containing protein 4 homolog [Convolutriloba macropyga]|uniref:MORN repeat-containing protein 4 homolog n=1 Tax=Convolutriloba macropyga TaxID=536237 RepID=UPI003F51B393
MKNMNAKSAITEILHGNSYNYGSYKYEDGSIYTGQWDSKGLRHGIGKLQFDEDKKNCYYEGQFKRGMPEGLGMLKTPYFVMQGQFKQGKLDGVGRCIRCDGLRYEGEFRNGEMTGLGIMTFPDGTHGTPTCEGLFDGSRMIARKNARDMVIKAVQVANAASAIVAVK